MADREDSKLIIDWKPYHIQYPHTDAAQTRKEEENSGVGFSDQIPRLLHVPCHLRTMSVLLILIPECVQPATSVVG